VDTVGVVALVALLVWGTWCGVQTLIQLAREVEALEDAERPTDTPDTRDDVTEGR
jgi:hypothetical protein